MKRMTRLRLAWGASMIGSVGLVPRAWAAEEPNAPSRQEAERAEGVSAGALLAQVQSRPNTQAQPATLGDELEFPPEDYELETRIGGALRFNLFYKSWDRGRSVRSSGDNAAFDTFRFDVESQYGPFALSGEYRFYAGYNMLHHGWLSYRLMDIADFKLGVVRVPFGPLPYASNNYFFNLGFYVGLEDDYDLGTRVDFDLGILDVQLAYFRNDEGSYSGSSIDSARYSYDVVRVDAAEIPALAAGAARSSEEEHQGNVRATLTAKHGEIGSTEFGLSGQLGRLEDVDDVNGHHWAAGAHLRGQYGPFGAMLQGARYSYEFASEALLDDRWVPLGAFDSPYRVASQAYLLAGSLSYRFDVDAAVLDSVTIYEEYSRLVKLEEGYTDSEQNVVGALAAMGPVYLYLDAVLGKNHPWIGPSYTDALAEGDANADWRLRVNANAGYHF